MISSASQAIQNPYHPIEDTSNRSASGRSISNAARQTTLEALGNECRPHLRTLAKQDPIAQRIDPQQLDKILNLIDETHRDDIPSTAQHLLENTIQTQPELIEVAIKYINAQLMILNSAENQLINLPPENDTRLHRSISSLNQTLQRTGSSVEEKLTHMKASPVFTGHPTHLNKPATVQNLLSEMLNTHDENSTKALCESLWAGLGHREQRPSVLEEAQHYAPYLKNTIHSSHHVQKQVQTALKNQHLGSMQTPVVELGSWVAGDRDGNPNITASTLHHVVMNHAKQVFAFYQHKLRQEGSLAKTLDKVTNSPSVNNENSLYQLGVTLYQAALPSNLKKIRDTLENTLQCLTNDPAYSPVKKIYDTPQAFAQALQELLPFQDIPDITASPTLNDKVNRLLIDIEGKGFYGASTDIRQNSAMNEKTVGHLLRLSDIHPNYSSLDENERCDLLLNVLEQPQLTLNEQGELPPDIQNELELVHAYKTIQHTFGEKALKNCITANTESTSDLLEVLVLLKHAGLVDDQGIHMNVMPLIETVPDLKNGPAILNKLLSIDWYKTQLQKAGNTQHVMVGYSDSTRLDGPLASSWAVHEGIHHIQNTLEQHGVKMHVFHGRGGTEARGSGHSYEQDIQYLDGNSLQEGFRQTEQGEEIPAKFGNPELAKNSLIEMLSTAIETSAQGEDPHTKTYAPVMNALQEHARSAYHALYNDPDLVPFFKNTTPIEFVKLSNAGSRPASRKETKTNQEYLANIRAIPWAAAWYQSGNMMPAYYGTGHALKQFCTDGMPSAPLLPHKVQTLKTMYNTWPFFKNLVDRTDLALHKANMPLAEQYAELDPSTRPVFEKIKDEFENTQKMLSLIKQGEDHPKTELLKQGVLARKDLGSWAQTMQVELIRASREPRHSEKADKLKSLVVQTMQANANSIGRFG